MNHRSFRIARGKNLPVDTAVRLLSIQSSSLRDQRTRSGNRARSSRRFSPAPASRYWLLLAAPVAWGFQNLAAMWPDTLESVYARGFYPVVTGAWSRLTGLLPVSLMELLLMLLVLLFPFSIHFWIRAIRNAPSGTEWKTAWRPVGSLLILLSVWYAISVPLWNLHYSRHSFSTLSGLSVAPATVSELQNVALQMVQDVNTARELVAEDESGVMMLSRDIGETFNMTSSGYDVLTNRFSFLGGRYGPPKPVMLSRLMSYTRIIGLYTVTTAEANVDVHMPDAEIPFTALHELAHLRGIAPEDEANAVAWFASRVHPDPDHRYSGALQAYLYVSNALQKTDPDAWQQVRSTLSPAVERDLRAQSAYWQQYDSVVDKVAQKANDVWLKSNGQSDGVQSYGRMVDLILAEYRQNPTN